MSVFLRFVFSRRRVNKLRSTYRFPYDVHDRGNGRDIFEGRVHLTNVKRKELQLSLEFFDVKISLHLSLQLIVYYDVYSVVGSGCNKILYEYEIVQGLIGKRS